MARGREATVEPGADAEEKAGAESREGGAGADVTPAGPGGASSSMIDLAFVKGLIEAVDGSGIDSLEITRAGTRVKISKTPPSAAPAPAYFAAAPNPSPAAAPAVPPGSPSAAPTAAGSTSGVSEEASGGGAAAEGSGLVEVKSPMVGTFYRSPAPEAPPYVEVGTKVAKGQTLCILEAMKLMNELESEVDGVVKDVLVENSEPVEYGQVLFRIDPNG